MLTGSQAAKVRVAGLELLQQLFSPATNLDKIETAGDELDVDAIVEKHLFRILTQSSKVSGSLTQVAYKYGTSMTSTKLSYKRRRNITPERSVCMIQ